MYIFDAMKPLNPKQKHFCLQFVRLNSLSEAYGLAYTPDKTKSQLQNYAAAAKLMTLPQVKSYINEIRDRQAIDVKEIICELANMVRFDPIDLLDDNGNVKQLKDMPKTARQMIAGLDISELWIGRGADREQYGLVKKIKFIDKLTAIEKLMKHLGAYEKDNDQKKSITQIAIFQLPDNNRTLEVGQPAPLVIDVTPEEVAPVKRIRPKGKPIKGNSTPAGSL